MIPGPRISVKRCICMAEFYCGRLSAPTPIKFQLLFLPTSLVNCAISAVRPREVSGVTNTVARIDVFTPKAIHTSATGIVTINAGFNLALRVYSSNLLANLPTSFKSYSKETWLGNNQGDPGPFQPGGAKGLDLGNAYCTRLRPHP